MQRPDQLACAKRLFAHIENRTTDMADATWMQASVNYTSPERLAVEKLAIYKKLPLLIGFSTDLANPGDFLTETFVGVPVLVVRALDGTLRAYVNICSHRAAPVATGCGKGARGFVCPFHGWVYDTEGRLVTIPGEVGFRPIDKAELPLQRLPVQEKYGLIWLGLTPGDQFEIDDHLNDLSRDFAAYGYEDYVHYKTMTMHKDMNWKLVMDTFLENYHLRTLHKNTIGDAIMSFVQLADPIGDNLRLIQARRSFMELKDQPEEEWDFYKETAIVYLLFPNTLFIHQSDHVEIWRSFPDSENPGSSKVYFDFYVPTAPETEKQKRYWDKNIEYGLSIVLGEDFVLGEAIQQGFASHLKSEVIFGRNESGLINYHEAIGRVINRHEGQQVAQAGAPAREAIA